MWYFLVTWYTIRSGHRLHADTIVFIGKSLKFFFWN